jgi:hypothetical protein
MLRADKRRRFGLLFVVVVRTAERSSAEAMAEFVPVDNVWIRSEEVLWCVTVTLVLLPKPMY